jgi:hypothetical protein
MVCCSSKKGKGQSPKKKPAIAGFADMDVVTLAAATFAADKLASLTA